MKMSRNIISLGFFGQHSARVVRECCTKAEEAGVDGVWFAEHIGEGRDAVTLAAVAAGSTTKTRIGFAVLNPFNRHPTVIASTAATLDELSSGRLQLGLGSGNPARLHEKMGIQFKNPLSTVKESVEIIRGLLTGETVNYHGDVFNVSNLALGFQPYRRDLPIYLAAVGEKMLKLSCSVADGVLFTFGSSKGYLRDATRLAREATGRKPSLVAICGCSISADSKKAKRNLASSSLAYLTRPGRAEKMFGLSGLPPELPGRLRSMRQEDAVRELVEGEKILNFGIAGTPEECSEQIDDFFSLGADEVILEPGGHTDEFYRNLARTLK